MRRCHNASAASAGVIFALLLVAINGATLNITQVANFQQFATVFKSISFNPNNFSEFITSQIQYVPPFAESTRGVKQSGTNYSLSVFGIDTAAQTLNEQYTVTNSSGTTFVLNAVAFVPVFANQAVFMLTEFGQSQTSYNISFFTVAVLNQTVTYTSYALSQQIETTDYARFTIYVAPDEPYMVVSLQSQLALYNLMSGSVEFIGFAQVGSLRNIASVTFIYWAEIIVTDTYQGIFNCYLDFTPPSATIRNRYYDGSMHPEIRSAQFITAHRFNITQGIMHSYYSLYQINVFENAYPPTIVFTQPIIKGNTIFDQSVYQFSPDGRYLVGAFSYFQMWLYTVDEVQDEHTGGGSSSSTSSNEALLIVAIVGGVLFVAAFALLAVLYKKQQDLLRKYERQQHDEKSAEGANFTTVVGGGADYNNNNNNAYGRAQQEGDLTQRLNAQGAYDSTQSYDNAYNQK